MPIKDRSAYPANWRQISEEVRQQAGYRCVHCGAVAGQFGAKDKRGQWHDQAAISSMPASQGDILFGDYPKIVKVVLTVAHLDQNPRNNNRANLRCLCAACHLEYDRPYNLAKAAVTRRRQRLNRRHPEGQLTLFDGGNIDGE